MSFGSFEQPGSQQAIAEINTTPLIDVLLVLLVVFLVTLPLASSVIPVTLPEVSDSQTSQVTSKTLDVTIDHQGRLFYQDQQISLSEVGDLFLSAQTRKMRVRFRVDARAEFDHIAQLLALASKHNIHNISFVTIHHEKSNN